MPIKARIDMLSTGIRTPVGIKVLGPKLEEIEKLGLELEAIIKDIPGTRSVYAERVTTGYFLDFNIKREEAARYGINVDDIQEVVQTAVGGMNLTTTVEGRERYPVNVRYSRELRNDIEKLKRVLVPVMNQPSASSSSGGFGGQQSGMGAVQPVSMKTLQVPLGELVDIKIVKGPTQIKSRRAFDSLCIYRFYRKGYRRLCK